MKNSDDNVGSGARSARRLNFNHGYVDLQSGTSARRYYVRDEEVKRKILSSSFNT